MLLNIDFSDETPIYMQIRNQIVSGIGQGTLMPGDKLPTIRTLANESGINMMTVSKAYQLLKQEGYIISNRRSGAVIKGKLPNGHFDQKLKDQLRQIVLEAKAHQVSFDEIKEYCETVFKEGENND